MPSTGEPLAAGRFYRDLESKLGKAQRANKKARVKAINAKIKHRRKDALRQFSTALVNANAAIFLGNMSPSKLAKTKLSRLTPYIPALIRRGFTAKLLSCPKWHHIDILKLLLLHPNLNRRDWIWRFNRKMSILERAYYRDQYFQLITLWRVEFSIKKLLDAL